VSKDSAADPATLLADLAKAHIAARCLHVAAECGVADALDERASPAALLAARIGVDPGALERVLRLLAAHGVFAHEDGGYVHTAASKLLRSDHPQSLRSYVRMTGLPAFWNGFGSLSHALRTGRPAADWASLVAHMRDNPEEAAVFNAAMVAKSRVAVPAVVEAYDFTGYERIADIGGGRGHLLRAILDRSRQSTGVLFELPHVLADTPSAGARCEHAAGDFFADPLPRADLYVLMDLLHDWADADAARILAAVRLAAPAGARLLIVETLVSGAAGQHFGKTLDIIMLAVTGGRERTREEYEALLRRAGFTLRRVLGTRSEYSLVEAIAD
jgi:hypothetical protein